MSDNSRTYYPTIGLEIHAELATNTKMFCRCANNAFDSEPNAHVCPVCMAHPGTLPVPNKQAIEHVINVGLVVNGEVTNFTEFDRKNYFYPDIPKGYQISQYKHPIVFRGELAGVKITRIHLEEDTATSQHSGNVSFINYNRAGVPLMELVTEPVIHSAEHAMEFAEELRLLLRTLGVSKANMECGEMRVEVNISVSPDKEKFGTKVEIKNLNSFNVVGRAIAYEIKRMTDLYEDGRENEIVQETRGWDDTKQITFTQRRKEQSEDYRYFPEPDIPKLYLHEMFNIDEMRQTLPELPEEKRNRYRNEYGIKDEDIESYINSRELAVLFENTIIAYPNDRELVKLTSNYITSDLVGLIKKGSSILENGEIKEIDFIKYIIPEHFATLIQMIGRGDISSRGAKDILAILATEGGNPEVIAKEKGLIQQHDESALRNIATRVITENPTVVSDFKAGKENAIKFLVGQGMKVSNGSANPTILEKILREMV